MQVFIQRKSPTFWGRAFGGGGPGSLTLGRFRLYSSACLFWMECSYCKSYCTPNSLKRQLNRGVGWLQSCSQSVADCDVHRAWRVVVDQHVGRRTSCTVTEDLHVGREGAGVEPREVDVP